MAKWTAEQERAIAARDKSVLVSASAGSGKTSVMIERVIRLISEKRARVEEILAVTFASSAAQDMKRKLYEALSAHAAEDAYFQREVQALDTADICTLHSFAADLLRQYFYEAEVDPQFRIISGQEQEVLRGAALTEVTEAYISEGDEAFIELQELYSRRRRDQAFRELILSAYEFVLSQPDPEGFLAERAAYGAEHPEAAEAYVNGYVAHAAAEITAELTDCIAYLSMLGMEKHCAVMETARAGLAGVCAQNDLAENARVLAAFPALGVARRSAKDTGGEEAVARYAAARSKAKSFVDDVAECFAPRHIARARRDKPELARRMRKFAEVLSRFDAAFSAAKRDKNALDFNDLERYCLKLLQREGVAARVRAKYRYVFVDEYQDVNGLQEAILSRVAGADNLFMVGDVKQSIYGFRLCDSAIFSEKYDRFRAGCGGEAVDLNCNFRSGAGILRFVNAVFSPVMTRRFGGTDYAVSSMLEPGAAFEPSELPAVRVGIVRPAPRAKKPELIGVPPYDILEAERAEEDDRCRAEAELVYRYLKSYLGREIYDPKAGGMRPVEYGDVVLLSRSNNDYAKGIARYLSERGVPVATQAQEKAGPETRLLLDFLRVLDNPKNDFPLAAVMRSVFGEFTDDELAEIRIADGGAHARFYACAEAMRGADTPLGKKLAAFYERIARYRLKLTFYPAARVLAEAVDESGFDIYLLAGSGGAERLRRAQSFLNGLEAAGVTNLTAYLAEIDAEGLEAGETVAPAGDCVRLMTIHKSKGLEFPVVFLIGTGQTFNLRDLSAPLLFDRTLGFAPDGYDLGSRTRWPSLVRAATRLKKRGELLEEELRVLYVALTRAENCLVVTGRANPDGWDAAPGLYGLYGAQNQLDFLAPALRAKQPGLLAYEEHNEAELTGEAALPRKAELSAGDAARAKEIEQALYFTYPYSEDTVRRQKFTVTGLLNEDRFADEERALSPEERQAAIDKGVSYHAVLEHADLFDTSLAAVEGTIANLKERGVIPERAEVDAGLVKACLDSALLDEARKYKTYREKAFMTLAEGSGARPLVQGKVDMLILTPEGAIVIDFKSGYIGSKKDAEKRYGKQLALYANAVEGALAVRVSRKVVYSIAAKRWFDV